MIEFAEHYEDDDNRGRFVLYAEDQTWDMATREQLKNEYGIYFMTAGSAVIPVMVQKTNGKYPLIILGIADDGKIWFNKHYNQYEMCFSAYWVKSLIADLQAAVARSCL